MESVSRQLEQRRVECRGRRSRDVDEGHDLMQRSLISGPAVSA